MKIKLFNKKISDRKIIYAFDYDFNNGISALMCIFAKSSARITESYIH